MKSKVSLDKDTEEKILVVVFILGGEELALAVNQVREIIRIPSITTVPNSSEYVEGVINLRGQVKTVLNLRKRLGMEEGVLDDKEGKIIIVEANEKTFGIIVDKVIGVLNVESENITDPASLLGAEKVDFIKGIGRLDDRLVILLEPIKLFSQEEMAAA
jgi:purine-binding chemotaxis protein CheW